MGKLRRLPQQPDRSSHPVNLAPEATGSGEFTPHVTMTAPSNEDLLAMSIRKESNIPTSGADDDPRTIYDQGCSIPSDIPYIPTSYEDGVQAPTQGSPQLTQTSLSPSLGGSASIDGSSSNQPTQAGGLFPNASHFSINNSVMAERVEVYQTNRSNVLERMVNYIIPGAEFDSSERDYPPRCHPGTRIAFLEQLQTCIHDNNLGTRIVWLYGPAGVGKSAIMQTLAETLANTGPPRFPCATLFFSRPNRRDDPKKVFGTLAYSFAVVHPPYRQYLGDRLAVDPGFLARSMEEQFKRLFIIPFTDGHIKTGPRRWVVLVDGLDECNGEREQCRIVGLIRDSIVHHGKTAPFIWIIASRPEAHLKPSFVQAQEETASLQTLEVPIDSSEAIRSVELYLNKEFAKIRRDYLDLVHPSWPSENDVLSLTSASSGLFIFASTLVGYIGEEDPVQRLEVIVSRIDRRPKGDSTGGALISGPEENPFQTLDLLYTAIMSNIPTDALPTAKAILGFYLLEVVGYRPSYSRSILDPPSFFKACNFLGYKQHTAYAALRRLCSVLTIPPPKEACNQPIRFLHASFPDFLSDRSRSQSYYIDLNQELERIWRCHLRVLRQFFGSRCDYNSVILSWDSRSPGIHIPVDYHPRHELVSKAKIKWLEILCDYCHGCTSCESTPKYRLSLDASELIQAFEEFGRVVWSDIQGRFNILRKWFTDKHAPLELRQKMIIKEFGLHELSEGDVDNMFRGFHTGGWGYRLSDRTAHKPLNLKNLDASEWYRIKQLARTSGTTPHPEPPTSTWRILGELLRASGTPRAQQRDATVTIIGTKPSEYFAVCGPLSWDPVFGEGTAWLMVPYDASLI